MRRHRRTGCRAGRVRSRSASRSGPGSSPGTGTISLSATLTSTLDDATLAANQANAFTVLTFGFAGVADGFSFVNLGSDLDFERNFTGLDAESLSVTVEAAVAEAGPV